MYFHIYQVSEQLLPMHSFSEVALSKQENKSRKQKSWNMKKEIQKREKEQKI